jgi:hypothetical protein
VRLTRVIVDGGLPLSGELIEVAIFYDVAIDYKLMDQAMAVVAESNRLADIAKNSYLLIAQHFYFSAVPGSAILRCCFARTSFGTTFATADWILFFMPVTTSLSPFSIAL